MVRIEIDYGRCQPQRCPQGRCLARKTCPLKALWQEGPFEAPVLNGGRCNGCTKCLGACPAGAIRAFPY